MFGKRRRQQRGLLGPLCLAVVIFANGCGGESSTTAQLALLAGAIGGPGNVDGVGRAARFEEPWAIASDGADALYVVDDRTIRKVSVSTGNVTTIAGAYRSYGDNDGPGSVARFSRMEGIATDGPESVYIADSGSNTIRKLDVASGRVTTLAGESGVSGSTDANGHDAGFSYPRDLVADGAGNLFVADSGNHTIRRIALDTGDVTTLAGLPGVAGDTDGIGPEAAFDGPVSLTYDQAGSLYVLERSQLRKIVVATGAVTTVVSRTDFAQNLGIDALGLARVVSDAASGMLYLVDQFRDTIVELDPATRRASDLAGLGLTRNPLGARVPNHADAIGRAARFARPVGLTSDQRGKLYVTELGNVAIREITEATAAVTTVAGDPPAAGIEDGRGALARFSTPLGLTSDGERSVFVADQLGNTIRRIDVTTGEVSTLAGAPGIPDVWDGFGQAARFFAPTDVACDRAGNLYVANFRFGAIRQVAIATREVSTLMSFLSSDERPAGIDLVAPEHLALDGRGSLYVTGNTQAVYRLVLATGEFSIFAGSQQESGSNDAIGGDARFFAPKGLASDGAGNLFVADSINRTIRKIEIATRTVTTLSEGFVDPVALACDGNVLYVADRAASTVHKVQLSTGAVTLAVGRYGEGAVRLGPLPAGLSLPSGLAILPSGDLLVSDDNAVLRAYF